jgi:hypothetical protein
MRRMFLGAAVLALIGVVQARAASDNPRDCLITVGPTQMFLTAYQLDASNDSFCRHMPELGDTQIILDTHERELRDMTVEVRLLRDVGQKDWRDDLDANTLLRLPPKKYLAMKGTMNFGYHFLAGGSYITLIRAASDDGSHDYVGEYFFKVGDTYERYLAGAVIAALLAFIVFGVWRGTSKPAQRKIALATLAPRHGRASVSRGEDVVEPVLVKAPARDDRPRGPGSTPR